jgi:hypothetical protein
MPDEGGFELARAYMSVDADIDEAEGEVDELKERAANLHGTLTIDADTGPASAKLDELEARAQGQGATVTVDADTGPADAEVDELRADVGSLSGTDIPLDADDAPAEAKLEVLKARIDQLREDAASFPVDADDAPAVAKLEALKGYIDMLTAEHRDITVGINDDGAEAKLASLELQIEGFRAQLDALGANAGAASAPIDGLGQSAGEAATRMDEGAAAAASMTGQLGPVAGAAAAAAVPMDALSEAEARFRDEVYSANPGIDDQTASLLAQAAAASAAGISLDADGAGLSNVNREAGGLADTLSQVRNILGAAGLGEELTVTATGMNQFLIEAAGDADVLDESLLRVTTGASLLDDAMLTTSNDMQEAWNAATALNLSLSQTENMAEAAYDALLEMGASELQAAAGANALVKAQQEFDDLMGGGAGGGGFLSGISSFFNVGGEGGGLAGTVASLSAGIGAAYAFAAAMAEVGGLVTGVSAAFTGLVPAVVLAIPAVEKIKDAFGDTRKELEKLPPAERDTILGIRGLKTEYLDMAKAFEPDVFKIFDEGVKVANSLLKESKPLADAAASGVEGLLKQADKFTQSQGFKQWLKQITPDIAPSIKAIGTTIGTIALDWGKFMKTFSPKDIQTTFQILDDLINWWSTGWIHAITDVMTMWDDFSTAFRNIESWTDTAMDGLKLFSDFVAAEWDTLASQTEQHWTDIGHDVENATDAIRETVISVGHDIESAWDETLTTMESSAKQDWGDISNAVSSALDVIREGVISAGHEIESAWDSQLSSLASSAKTDWDDIDNDVSDALDTIRESVVTAGHDIESAWDAALSEVENTAKTDWDDISHAVSEALGDIREDVISAGHDIESAWDAAVSDVERITDDLIHDVESDFERLPGELEHLGQEAMNGLIQGIQSRDGDLESELNHIANSIPSRIEKLLGIHSPSLVMRDLAHDTMEGYRLGILDYETPIAAAIKQVGGATPGAAATAFTSHGAAVPVASTIGHAAGGTTVNNSFTFTGVAFPSPEQVHAMQMAMATAVGVSG